MDAELPGDYGDDGMDFDE